ncbi:hypothetical protein ACFE04_031093 [Oxalis oulophora]
MAAEEGGYIHRQQQEDLSTGTSEMINPMPPTNFNYYGLTAGGMNNIIMLPMPTDTPTPTPATSNSSMVCSPGICNSSSPSSSLIALSTTRQDTTTTTTTTAAAAPGLASDWSLEEQYKLKEGLEMYANEPTIMKYIKIAAYLRDKTVRDVAVRCRWMTSKRRKPEEHNMGKKVNNRKDKMVESSSNANMASVHNMVAYPLMVHQNECMLFEGINGTTRHLLEQNARDFDQIRDNLLLYRLQENIELFYRTRNNIAAILIDMRETPGIMSQMPPLPVSINEDLANSLLPSTTTTQMMFGGIQLMKQEPRW